MYNESQIANALEKIEGQVPGFIAASLVDVESGMTLGARTVDQNFDLTMASAFNSELVKQKQRIIETLGLHGALEDMVITLSDQIHHLRLVGPGTFLYIAVSRRASNPAIVRAVVGKHLAEFAD
jgi:predicted regulator of Ras-like GTPase activity (Roadblock/LC7/MglB family)